MIVGVAFLNKKNKLLCSLPKPNRHNDIIHALYEVSGKQVLYGEWEQGFIDERGQFYTRKDAATYVLEVKQDLTERTYWEISNGGKLDILFSEDIW